MFRFPRTPSTVRFADRRYAPLVEPGRQEALDVAAAAGPF